MKKLFRKAPCGHCEAYIDNGTRGIGCIGCRGTGEVYVELDPADLELGAVMVLEGLKKYLCDMLAKCGEMLSQEQTKEQRNRTSICKLQLGMVGVELDKLESGLDLGKLRKVREKARAWDLFRKEAKTSFDVHVDLTDRVNELLDIYEKQAQAELVLKDEGLEAEGKEATGGKED